MTWNEISLVVVDPVDPDVTATIMDIVTQRGYTPPADANSLGTMSKAKAAGALGTVTVTLPDVYYAERFKNHWKDYPSPGGAGLE